MSLQVEKLEKNMAKLTIEVPAEELDKATTTVYNQQKGQFKVQGFRQGKVPQAFLEKMYGVGLFFEEAANLLINEYYPKELEACDLDIVSKPSINIEQIEKGKPFIFTAEVAVKPEVTLGEYKGVKIEKVESEVSDDEVLAALTKVQEENARVLTIDDRAIQDGDSAIIDYSGSIDGVKFDGGTAADQTLVIGSHTFIDNFEEQLIGKNIGEEVEVKVTFPEAYQAEELAGKEAIFVVNIKGITAKELPEIDEDFAQDVSEFDTLDEYKADIKAKLLVDKEKEAKIEKENRAIDAVIEAATMDIPELMIESQQSRMLDDFGQRLSQQGLQLDQYYQFAGLSEEALLEQMKPQALKQIQTRLVLEAVVAAEGIEASEEEYEKSLTEAAAMYQMEADKLKELLSEYDEKQMKADIAVQNALELVTKEAKEA